MNTRRSAVAGQFYPNDKKTLKKQVEDFLEKSKTAKINGAIGAVAPHAGYSYSGAVAAYSYNAIAGAKPKNVVILGPNHTGYGEPVAIDASDEWETPLGNVSVNSELCEKIANNEFLIDSEAHEYEHSIEVNVPFLQCVFNDFEIVPICIGDQRNAVMRSLGERLAKMLGTKDIVIASTDFSHYVPYETAYANDLRAINDVIKLDADALYATIKKNDVSMCGYGGVAALIEYAKQRGATKAELLKYATSGDVTNDKTSVVGYSSLIVR
jgi:hypothetical protein